MFPAVIRKVVMNPIEAPFRDRALVDALAGEIRKLSEDLDTVRIMHVCGTHEHEIARTGLRQLLPENLTIIPGPGCPVCITPASYIETAISLSLSDEKPVVCTYGDMVRVPGPNGSLLEARGRGADIRIIYGVRDALAAAETERKKPVVFFSVGFETTAAPVAAVITGGLPDNLFIYPCHRYVPPAVEALVSLADDIDGFLLPGHASVITGTGPYRKVAESFGKAAAVGGFEPVDILTALLSIVRQVKSGRPAVTNCYRRAVRDGGNVRAMESIGMVFRRADADWRGLGILPGTGLELSGLYEHLDARNRFGISQADEVEDAGGCRCHEVLLGKISPSDCALFSVACTPMQPKGPCMVSGEGTCRAAFLYPEVAG